MDFKEVLKLAQVKTSAEWQERNSISVPSSSQTWLSPTPISSPHFPGPPLVSRTCFLPNVYIPEKGWAGGAFSFLPSKFTIFSNSFQIRGRKVYIKPRPKEGNINISCVLSLECLGNFLGNINSLSNAIQGLAYVWRLDTTYNHGGRKHLTVSDVPRRECVMMEGRSQTSCL